VEVFGGEDAGVVGEDSEVGELARGDGALDRLLA
jgi:hypothetical protein